MLTKSASVCTALLGTPTRRFTWCRAGHPFPIVKTKGKPLITLTEGAGLPLGILDDAVYESESIILEPGQTVVLYTDGIIESLNPRGEEFGFDGVEHMPLLDGLGRQSSQRGRLHHPGTRRRG